ncbi:uncharacterized protein LOC132871714 [Neoarius graeffei]|uniref:uncharacterized protein LOC132871714 n=1 Tax=Neoarius graeffei TaxID=443677 RepID=UPI00298C0B36|nr:uncharacterized protein LOC132871714 [Neoarius graeffei]XP_060762131.1 uncharacterized protein LOC132871714 [Neoarius graeffei]
MSGGLSKICTQSMLRLSRTRLTSLKSALQTTPTLGLPDPNKPFVQTVDEKKGFMTSVLLQKHGDRLRPVAYFSNRLDPVAAGLPVCLRAVAAAEKAATASRNIVGYSNLTLLVPHAVSLLLLEKKTSHLSAQRWLKYNTVMLDMPNIIVKRCSVVNSASLLPTEDDGEPHDCVALTNDFCSPRADLKSDPLENPVMVLYVDGSASRDGKEQSFYPLFTASGPSEHCHPGQETSLETGRLYLCKLGLGLSLGPSLFTKIHVPFLCKIGTWTHPCVKRGDGSRSNKEMVHKWVFKLCCKILQAMLDMCTT